MVAAPRARSGPQFLGLGRLLWLCEAVAERLLWLFQAVAERLFWLFQAVALALGSFSPSQRLRLARWLAIWLARHRCRPATNSSPSSFPTLSRPCFKSPCAHETGDQGPLCAMWLITAMSFGLAGGMADVDNGDGGGGVDRPQLARPACPCASPPRASSEPIDCRCDGARRWASWLASRRHTDRHARPASTDEAHRCTDASCGERGMTRERHGGARCCYPSA